MQFIEYDFMNKWYTIVLLAIICGCSSSKSGILDDIEIIPVDVDNISPDASSFIGNKFNSSKILHVIV